MLKRLLFIVCLLVFTSIGNTLLAQKTSLKDIVGQWYSDETSVKLVFFFDRKGALQLVEWDTTSGEEMDIQQIEAKKEQVETVEKMKSTEFVTRNTYKLVDDDTIENIVKEEEGGKKTTLYFKRLK